MSEQNDKQTVGQVGATYGPDGGNSVLPIVAGSGGNGNIPPFFPRGQLLSTSNLPKLDGTNFASWFDLISIVLELRGIKSAIENENADTVANLQAKLILLESMDENHRAQVRGCDTAKAIIERLRLVYADKSAANIYRLLMQYYRFEKQARDSISVHVGRMDEMRNQLADLGEKQSEAVYQISRIGSLPAEYSSIMEVWELTPKEMRTMPNLVTSRGRLEESRCKCSSLDRSNQPA